MKILFSPIGTTDPIAGYHDGSMLHIARVYQPDVIYLYLSEEMLHLHELDDRYRYCLYRLSESIGKKIDIRVIERPDLVEVQKFDTFIKEFRERINEVLEENKNNEVELLLNVSSGTPAMKSALQALSLFLPYSNIKAIQVDTPAKSANYHREDVKKYPTETHWEVNEDNEPDFVNRCSISSTENFIAELQKEILIKQIDSYDYHAAITTAKATSGFIKEEVVSILRATDQRLKFNYKEAEENPFIKKYKLMPYYNMNNKKMNKDKALYEYFLVIGIKLKKQEYADFARSLTPYFFEILKRLLEKELRIQLDKCTSKGRWDTVKFGQNYPDFYRAYVGKTKKALEGNVYSAILIEFLKLNPLNQTIDTGIVELAAEIRKHEEKIRNPLAHELISYTDATKKYQLNDDLGYYYAKLRKLSIHVGLDQTQNIEDSFDKMNQKIKDLIKS